MKPRLKISIVLIIWVSLTLWATTCRTAPPLFGLSTVMGTTVLGSTVLGSTVLGSSILGTTTTTIATYDQALWIARLYSTLACISLLSYVGLADFSMEDDRCILVDIRKSLIPIVILLVVLFSIFFFSTIWAML